MGIAPLPDPEMADPGSATAVPPRPIAPRVTRRRRTDPPGAQDLRGKVDGLGAVLTGGANVILQLSWPEVAYGVMESKVHDGNLARHPYKRTRTTLTYLAVAMYGDEELRRDFRKAVNRQHAQVRSGPDSPVRYNAFDPELQLWVASCLYFGARDAVQRVHGTVDPETEAAWFRAGKRFATTLQVPEELWHADVAAFERYWEAGLARATMDEPTKAYLRGFLDVSVLPKPIGPLLRPVVQFFNTGFLPAEIREQLEVPWTERQERAHARSLRVLGTVAKPLPDVIKAFPFNVLLLDVKLRRRFGRRLV